MANEKRLMYVNDFLDLFYVASAGQDKAFIKAVEMVVEDTPTVDAVEVVHGEWVDDIFGQGDMICSECEQYPATDEDGNPLSALACWQPEYCPNCGAKMDGGNEDGNL